MVNLVCLMGNLRRWRIETLEGSRICCRFVLVVHSGGNVLSAPCIAFGKQAVLISRAQLGQLITVHGSFRTRRYIGYDNKPCSSYEILADEVLLGPLSKHKMKDKLMERIEDD